MLNIEVIKFEAQDVITASGVAEKTHKHHWSWNERKPGTGIVGVEGNKGKILCVEPDCNSTTIVPQPVSIVNKYEW